MKKPPPCGRGQSPICRSTVLLQAETEASHSARGGSRLSSAAEADKPLQVVAVEGDHLFIGSVANGGEGATSGCGVAAAEGVGFFDAEGKVRISAGSGAGEDDLNIALIAGQVHTSLIASGGDGGGGQKGEVLELIQRELMDCHWT